MFRASTKSLQAEVTAGKMLLMSEDVAAQRARALRVAKWLLEKGRPDDAVCVLSAWAVEGPNDSSGQQLLAEALRIDPSSKVAQQAFERMEGMTGEHELLDDALARFGEAALKSLEEEFRRPTFRRAQMGFNNNIRFGGRVFHVQTEDSGLDAPHIITHLFADGGRVIKSHKRSYADAVHTKPDIATYVRELMKAQHLEMVIMLRDGRFDAVIEGREIGGISFLEEPPKPDIVKRINKKRRPPDVAGEKPHSVPPSAQQVPPSAQQVPPSAQQAPPSAQQAPPASAPQQLLQTPLYRLMVTRSLYGGPESYAPVSEVTYIGANGQVPLLGERFCHPREALLIWREGRLFVEDLEEGNGVFVKIQSPTELAWGDEFVVGDQLLRLEQNPMPDDEPDPAPTYFYSSPKWVSSFRVVQILEGGALGACVVARGNALQIGSVMGDLVFSDDPLVGHQHCLVEETAGTVVLTDLDSRSGLFVRVRGEFELVTGDELMIGRTRLSVDLSS